MSSASTPSHNPFSTKYESVFYDPEYTAAISTRMQVPDRISVYSDDDGGSEISSNSRGVNLPTPPPEREKIVMNVPSRIVIAGDNQPVGEPDEPLELKLDNLSMQPRDSIPLVPPPQSISLSEHKFPTVESEDQPSHPELVNNGYLPAKKGNKDLSLVAYPDSQQTSVSQEDELAALRMDVHKLLARVNTLELDNQHKQQKELVFCSIGVFYFILKGIFWLHRNW